MTTKQVTQSESGTDTGLVVGLVFLFMFIGIGVAVIVTWVCVRKDKDCFKNNWAKVKSCGKRKNVINPGEGDVNDTQVQLKAKQTPKGVEQSPSDSDGSSGDSSGDSSSV